MKQVSTHPSFSRKQQVLPSSKNTVIWLAIGNTSSFFEIGQSIRFHAFNDPAINSWVSSGFDIHVIPCLMSRSIRRGHRILMARGKLGVLLMALLLAVSRPKREWTSSPRLEHLLAIGVTCFGVQLEKKNLP